MRLVPQHQAVRFVDFPLTEKRDEDRQLTLIVAPAIADAAEQTFSVGVGPCSFGVCSARRSARRAEAALAVPEEMAESPTNHVAGVGSPHAPRGRADSGHCTYVLLLRIGVREGWQCRYCGGQVLHLAQRRRFRDDRMRRPRRQIRVRSERLERRRPRHHLRDQRRQRPHRQSRRSLALTCVAYDVRGYISTTQSCISSTSFPECSDGRARIHPRSACGGILVFLDPSCVAPTPVNVTVDPSTFIVTVSTKSATQESAVLGESPGHPGAQRDRLRHHGDRDGHGRLDVGFRRSLREVGRRRPASFFRLDQPRLLSRQARPPWTYHEYKQQRRRSLKALQNRVAEAGPHTYRAVEPFGAAQTACFSFFVGSAYERTGDPGVPADSCCHWRHGGSFRARRMRRSSTWILRSGPKGSSGVDHVSMFVTAASTSPPSIMVCRSR